VTSRVAAWHGRRAGAKLPAVPDEEWETRLADLWAAFDDCPEARRAHLVAQSGLRGASDLWMNPAAHGHGALAKAAQ